MTANSSPTSGDSGLNAGAPAFTPGGNNNDGVPDAPQPGIGDQQRVDPNVKAEHGSILELLARAGLDPSDPSTAAQLRDILGPQEERPDEYVRSNDVRNDDNASVSTMGSTLRERALGEGSICYYKSYLNNNYKETIIIAIENGKCRIRIDGNEFLVPRNTLFKRENVPPEHFPPSRPRSRLFEDEDEDASSRHRDGMYGDHHGGHDDMYGDHGSRDYGSRGYTSNRHGRDGRRHDTDPFGGRSCNTFTRAVTGVSLRNTPRKEDELLQTSVFGVKKEERGKTQGQRIKSRANILIQAPRNILSPNNIATLLNTEDADNFDVGEEQQGIQSKMYEAHQYFQNYDLASIFTVPIKINLNDKSCMDPDHPKINLLTDYHNKMLQGQMGIKLICKYLDWAELWLSEEDLESVSIATSALSKMMNSALTELVISDLQQVEQKYHSAPMKLLFAIQRITVCNQAAIDALQNYVRVFDIRSFPGQDVTLAITRILAVVRMLGNTNLPENVFELILGGFSHSSSDTFNSSAIMLRTSVSSSILGRDIFNDRSNAIQTIQTMCTDLERLYLGEKTSNKWPGIGQQGSSSFVVQPGDAARNDEDDRLREEYNIYKAEFPSNRRSRALPFEEWIKTAKCNNCGEKGHIASTCTKPRRQTQGGRTERRRRPGNRTPRNREHTPRQDERERTPRQNEHEQDGRRQDRVPPGRQQERRRFDRAFAAFRDMVLEPSDDEASTQDEGASDEESESDDNESDARITYTCAQVRAGFNALKE